MRLTLPPWTLLAAVSALLAAGLRADEAAPAPTAPPELEGPVAVTPLSWGTFNHQAVTIGRRIYVVGGWRRRFVWWNEAAEDGSLGKTWQRGADIPESMACNYLTAAASDTHLYVLGGHWTNPETDKTERLARVMTARVKADGSVEPWQDTTALPDGTSSGMAVVLNQRLYYLAGQYQRRVFFAPIGEDGSLGDWVETRRMKSNRGSAGLVVFGGHLYVVGGERIHRRYANTVLRAELKPDGHVRRWQRTEPLPVETASFAWARVGRDVYVFGGANNLDSILATTIEEDLHFGDWRRVGNTPVGASAWEAVSIGPYVYLVGGITVGDERNTVHSNVWRYRVRQK